jgi:LysW-gamma-L-lysine carboxypeptidase
VTPAGGIDDEAAVELLRALCDIPSVSGDEAAAVAFMVERAASAGMEASVDEAGNFVAIRGRGEPTIVLLGHIDTVDGFIPARVEAGVLHGRGAVDAKGPLATFLVATSRMRSQGDGTVVIVGAVEEEAPSSKGAHFVVGRYAPAFAVIGEPSGVEAVTLGYKGRVGFALDGARPRAHSAGATRSVAREAVAFWAEAERFCDAFNQDRSIFARIDPDLESFDTETDGFEDRVALRGSFRLPEDAPVAGLERALTARAAGWGRVTLHDRTPAYRVGKRNALVRAFLPAIRARGLEPRFTLKTGTSDMNVVGPAWQCPIVAYGPGDSRLDHAPKEQVRVEEYLAAIDVMATVVEKLMG